MTCPIPWHLAGNSNSESYPVDWVSNSLEIQSQMAISDCFQSFSRGLKLRKVTWNSGHWHLSEFRTEFWGLKDWTLMWKHELLQPLWLSLGCFSELGRLSYLIWKRGLRATCWYENQDCNPTDRYFMIIFWYSLGSANSLLHFGLSLCSLLEHTGPPYPIWKGTSIASIWGIWAWPVPKGCRVIELVLV